MRICLVTGSYPPDVCGVGHYTANLARALRVMGPDVECVTRDRWGILDAAALKDEIVGHDPEIVHIQYPSVGYGRRLGPQALSLSLGTVPTVVTLHEFSEAHPLRRLSTLAFSVRSRAMVFPSEGEKESYLSWAPLRRERAWVIPIGSNIPTGSHDERDEHEIVYFGLIRPDKGIEQFLELADLARQKEPKLRFKIIGNPHPEHVEYAQRIQSEARQTSVAFWSGLDDEEVSGTLGHATFAYLPFPDGASPRRGSLLAALSNGLVVLTKRGPHTTKELEAAIVDAPTPAGALTRIRNLLENPKGIRAQREKSSGYILMHSWDRIAQEHIQLYRSLL